VKIISVNVGKPRDVLSGGRTVRTGIFKAPVAGRVAARRFNLDGDGQADLRIHGGQDKAVYVYPSEHYAFWSETLPGIEFSWGMFGENLTLEGLVETDIRIGDRLAIGSAEFAVTRPRMPCFKLALRFGRPDMVKRFLHSGRTGWYLAVVQEGEIGAGDDVTRTSGANGSVTIADVWRDNFRKQQMRGAGQK
jgi:MOSC domain-containing protein YiiM